MVPAACALTADRAHRWARKVRRTPAGMSPNRRRYPAANSPAAPALDLRIKARAAQPHVAGEFLAAGGAISIQDFEQGTDRMYFEPAQGFRAGAGRLADPGCRRISGGPPLPHEGPCASPIGAQDLIMAMSTARITFSASTATVQLARLLRHGGGGLGGGPHAPGGNTMVTTRTDPMATAVPHTVAAAFDSEDRTVAALNDLKAAGFTSEHVSVVAKDKRQMANVADRTDMDTGEAAAAGAATGGVLGGLAGFLVGVSALVIPGIGPIVGGGILLSTLAGAGLGAAAGGLVGALVEQGVPEEHARTYERHVGEGRTLVTVGAGTHAQAEEAERILHAHGGADVGRFARNA
jgi:uncharacterized membrane protein